MNQGRLVVVANRLPVSVASPDIVDDWKTSPGGLVSALSPILQAQDGAWVGWSGHADHEPAPFSHEGIHLVPTRIDKAEEQSYYMGFSNSTLWPLYHDAVRWPEFHRHWWWPYREVNQRFAERTADVAQPGDIVWVQDYHLQLVPAILRGLRPDVRSGFFLHIPFPPPELFAQLPWRRELLEGLLGADLIGFQTQSDVNNFMRAIERFTDAQFTDDCIFFQGRAIRAGAYPISIETERFTRFAADPAVQERAQVIKQCFGKRKLFLGVDRLDYTKGIHHRLRAFETLLKRIPNAAEKVAFLQIAVPTRGSIPQYANMRERIEQLIGHINGEYSSDFQIPVHYLHQTLSASELTAHYMAADVMCVTPLRDGMNLVAKEFPITRMDERGVLVLSEFAGAARQLTEAVPINPHDIDGMARAFQVALEMDEVEQTRRMRSMRKAVLDSTVHDWANDFLSVLAETAQAA